MKCAGPRCWADDINPADCESGADVPMPDGQKGLDPAEISEIAAFIDQCSVDVWMRVRSHLRAEWAANRIRLQEALEVSRHRKAAQLSRFRSRRAKSKSQHQTPYRWDDCITASQILQAL
jgi:hypothetical protein